MVVTTGYKQENGSNRAESRSKITRVFKIIFDRVTNKKPELAGENAVPLNMREKKGRARTADDIGSIMSELKKALQKNSKDEQALEGLGMSFYRLGDYSKAVNLFEKVVEINKRNAHAFFGLGYAYAMLDKPREALAAYEQAGRLDPTLTNGALYIRHDMVI